MPLIEICQENRSSFVYGSKIPHKRTFTLNHTIIGLSNKTSGFLKDKLMVFQDGRLKYRMKESNRFSWALNRFLPIFVLFPCVILCIFLPQYDFLWILLLLLSIVITSGFIARQYTIFEGGMEIGVSQEKWTKSVRSFSIQGNTYRIYSHSHERYSLFKNEIQIALYERKLEKSKNRYLIYYAIDESIEIIELFCFWIDMFYYDDERGIIILKTYPLSDKHPEYMLWRPKDVEQ